MNNLKEYLRKIRKNLLFFGLCMGIMGGIFLLYGVSAEPVIYGGALCALAGLGFFSMGTAHT